jgi:hypothetical protein
MDSVSLLCVAVLALAQTIGEWHGRTSSGNRTERLQQFGCGTDEMVSRAG